MGLEYESGSHTEGVEWYLLHWALITTAAV